MRRLAIFLTALMMMITACSGLSSDGPVGGSAIGKERGQCFSDGTCNAGLTCLSNTCVKASGSGTDGGGVADGLRSGSDDAGKTSADSVLDANVAQRVNEAGQPCPGATIFHPGTETRNANTSIQFVGRGRDSMCMPITGAKLVWTDSVGGTTIGTGEMFNYPFFLTGMHTITLTSTDGQGASTSATITFMIQ